jgi:hypothetical protein
MPRLPLALLPTLFLTAASVLRIAAQGQSADVTSILNGVQEIAAPGTPGTLCVFGDQAFPVALGGSGAGAFEPVVAAARLGTGRMVAFGHDGYLAGDVTATGNSATLLRNIFGWLSSNKAGAKIGVIGLNGLPAILQSLGLDASLTTASKLTGFDVIVPSMGTKWTRAEIDSFLAFVRNGGGLAAAATGWGWASLNSTSSLMEDFPGNWLLAPAGMVWGGNYLSRTSSLGFATTTAPSPLTHAASALDAATATNRALATAERTQVTSTLTAALQSIPAADTLFLPRLTTTLAASSTAKVPTPKTPIAVDNILGRLAVANDFRQMGRLSPTATTAHPSAATFPGSVAASAARVTRTVTIRPQRPRWHSTGLYAPAGEVVTVRIPASAAGKGLAVRIGAHSDRLWSVDSWRRFPEVSFNQTLTATETNVANPFGGLIYIEVPSGSTLSDFTAEIAGGVLAPRFVKGETTLEEWRSTIRNHPAPWAEIEGTNFIVTTQSSVLRTLNDPLAVADVWDQVLDTTADLATISRTRLSPERMVCDEQISAGYMHAGYPIMTWLDVNKLVVDAPFIGSALNEASDQNWGFFHEIGHNHQNSDWTFDGTGEVTVNLFTLHTFENLVGQTVANNPRGSLAFRQKTMAKFDFTRPNFTLWKSDAFLALIMYEQLQQAFGWDAYKAVFAEYLALPQSARPQNDDQKRDQWMTRFSRKVRRNLAPFFEAWGIPTSASARAALSDLPWWLPEEMKAVPMPNLPRISTSLESLRVPAGGDADLKLGVTSAGTASVQWMKDGSPIAGATNATLSLKNTGLGDAGAYWAKVTTAAGIAFSNAVTVAVESPLTARLSNLSVLTTLAPGEVMIAGTVIGGAGTSGSKALLARAAGPALAPLGVTGTLPDPVITLFSSASPNAVASNDNWRGDITLKSAFNQVGAFGYGASESADAAVFSPALAGGAYTAQVRDSGAGKGTVIVELYDATPASALTAVTPRLINVSVLKQIGPGETVTTGFVVAGSPAKKVLIRAVGPALGVAPFNIDRVMSDPRIDLYSGSTVIASNDNWGSPTSTTAASAATLAAAFVQVGAFALPAASKDAALVVTLPEGAYTARISGVNNAGGWAITEVYEVP